MNNETNRILKLEKIGAVQTERPQEERN